MANSHGTGMPPWNFRDFHEGSILEQGVLVFHPENISIGSEVYIGHQTILKAYYRNRMLIGNGCWIGQQCFFHSAGGLIIENNVGIGPGVKIITSTHKRIDGTVQNIIHCPLEFKKVHIGEGSDIGINAVILPGVTIGKRVQVGAGAVVTRSFADDAVVAGVPAVQIG